MSKNFKDLPQKQVYEVFQTSSQLWRLSGVDDGTTYMTHADVDTIQVDF